MSVALFWFPCFFTFLAASRHSISISSQSINHQMLYCKGTQWKPPTTRGVMKTQVAMYLYLLLAHKYFTHPRDAQYLERDSTHLHLFPVLAWWDKTICSATKILASILCMCSLNQSAVDETSCAFRYHWFALTVPNPKEDDTGHGQTDIHG
jgi:hypothetical protein